MNYTILVEVDSYDALYTDKITTITDKRLEMLLPLFKAIKEFKPYATKKDGNEVVHIYNFPHDSQCDTATGELTVQELYSDINPEIIEFFITECCPVVEDGFHTITSVQVVQGSSWQILI
jgi:hypothetical protein